MKNHSGQVSLEALLLFGVVAASLALVIPVFAHAVEAYSLLSQTRELDSFSDRLSGTLIRLSFSAPGTREVLSVPSFPGFAYDFSSEYVHLTLDSDRFSSPHFVQVHSPLPLEGNPLPDTPEWELVRSREGITIQ